MTAVGAFADFVGAPELAEERFQAKESRIGHVDELAGILRRALAGVDPREFFQRGASMNLLTGFVQTADQLLACPQLAARGSFVQMPGTLGGKPWRMPFTTALMTRTPLAYRRAAPALGEHNAEILAAQEVVS
jgi:crotonobetainyl-CoA:carnitine CoA-transferase CaiB-like acyl-CoA transferase